MNVMGRNSAGNLVERPIAPQPVQVTAELEWRFLSEPRLLGPRVQHWREVPGGLRVRETVDGEPVGEELFYRGIGNNAYMTSMVPIAADGPTTLMVKLV